MLMLLSSIALNAMKMSYANMPGWSTCPNNVFQYAFISKILLIKWPLDVHVSIICCECDMMGSYAHILAV